MDMGVISLCVLLAVVVLGFVRKANVGVLAIAAAAILAYASDQITAKQVVGGFSASLFMTLLGVTLLFGVIHANGCLEIVMKKLVRAFGTQVWLIPVLMYVVGWVMSAIGPGCVPTLAFVAVLAIPLAHETGYDPIMLMLIGDVATYSGRWSPISPEGILVSRLMGEQGFTGLLSPMILNTGIGSIIFSIIVFIYYRGFSVKGGAKFTETTEIPALEGRHTVALLGILAMLAGVLFLKMDVGLASFIVAAVLILIGISDQKTAFKGVPWNTLILVCGVGVLMNLVISTGGIKLLANAMSSVMSPNTAAPIAGLCAGAMSWFSSTMGVVLPTLLPTVGTIVGNVGGGVSVIEIISTIGIISSCAGFSPASTVGAIIMGAYEGDAEFSQQRTSNGLFLELFAWSVFCVLFFALLSWMGLFGFMG